MFGDWSLFFPGCEPLGHRMKAAFPSRRVRFHSLPGSKRYPEDEAEWAIALGRQNRVLEELTGPGDGVILLTTECSDSAATPSARPELGDLDPGARPWRTVPMHDVDDNFAAPSYWHVFASEWTWSPGVFDPILRLVAEAVIVNVMILPPGCTWLFHPYDGGMDLILESPAARDRFKSTHAGWLSPHPDGL